MAWGNRLLDDSRLVDGVTDCWTVWASVWLSGDAGQGEDVLFTTGKRAYLSHHPWPTWTQKWTRELRWNVNTSCPVLFPNFTLSFVFRSPSPSRPPWISVKGSFMDLRVQGAVKVQHLKNKTRQNQNYYYFSNQRCNNSSEMYLLLT